MVNKKGLFKKLAMGTGMTLGLVASSLGLNKEACAESVRPDYSPIAISQNLLNQDYNTSLGVNKNLSELIKRDNIESKSSGLEGKDLLNLAVAWGLSQVIHESGHYLAGLGMGFEPTMHYEKVAYNSRKGHSKDQDIFSTVAGPLLPMIVSESLLQSGATEKNNLSKWFVVANAFYNAVYVLKDATGAYKGPSDFSNLEKNGIRKEITYPAVLIPSAWQAYRALKGSKDMENISLYGYPTQNGFETGISIKGDFGLK